MHRLLPRPPDVAEDDSPVEGGVVGTPETARWDTGAVLSTLADHTDADLLARILLRLPPGYALLFGRAELA